MVNDLDIGVTFNALVREMCLDFATVEYIGYFDKENSRQYNFRIEPTAQPKPKGFKLVEIESALKVLGPEELEIVLSALGRK